MDRVSLSCFRGGLDLLLRISVSISRTRLGTFRTITIRKDFAGTTRQLFLARPTVSSRIHGLRRHFNILLFRHGGHSIHLASLNRHLLDVARHLFIVRTRTRRLLRSSRTLRANDLVLTISTPIRILPRVTQFYRHCPNVDIGVRANGASRSLSQLFGCRTSLTLLKHSIDSRHLVSLPLHGSPVITFISHGRP